MKFQMLTILFLFISIVPAAAEEIIKEYSGTETVSSEPFTVTDGWEIRWETKGQYLQILLNTDKNVPLEMPIQQMGPGSGTYHHAEGGTFILDMNASGEWKVTIMDVDEK